MKKLIYICAIALVVVFVIGMSLRSYSNLKDAEVLYQAKCNHDSVTFVTNYAYADDDVIRKYKRMVRDSIAFEKEYTLEIARANNEYAK